MSDIRIDMCPVCEVNGIESQGKIDYRIKIDGRYVYKCTTDPEHKWQDMDEIPSTKGFVVLNGR